MVYTVTLNPAIDYVVHLREDLRPGELNRNDSEDIQYGGKGINVSNVLRTLGVDTVALGFVAGFTGEGLEKGLQAMGLTTRFLHLSEGMTRINVKVKAGEETEINGIGPVIREADMARLYIQLEELQQGDLLVLSGSIPGCLPEDSYEKIMSRVHGRGIETVVDAAGDLLVNCLKHRPFLVKPNHLELGEIFGQIPCTEEEITEFARRLQQMGGRNVLVSMAGEGALLLDEHGTVRRIHCPKGEVVNSVGAGGSMVAGFLAGYLQTRDYGYALKLGTAAGSATAFSLGLADKDSIEKTLKRM